MSIMNEIMSDIMVQVMGFSLWQVQAPMPEIDENMIFITDNNGAYLTDNDGKYLITKR